MAPEAYEEDDHELESKPSGGALGQHATGETDIPKWGVWGGTTLREREALQEKLKRADPWGRPAEKPKDDTNTENTE